MPHTDRLSRRAFGAGAAALLAQPALAQSTPQPKLDEDGLYQFDWYLKPQEGASFGALLDAANARKKRLAILWTMRGCPYCKRLATDYFVNPQMVSYLRAKFDVLHLDMNGGRMFADFDGASFAEKSIGYRHAINVSPTIALYPRTSAEMRGKPPEAGELGRIPGLPPFKTYLAMLSYVAENGYEREEFGSWLKKRS